jgi:iron(III) transport system permease protein
VTRQLVLGGAILALVALVVWPLVVLLGELVRDPAALGALAAPLNLRAAVNTVLLSLATLALALGLGVPLGFLLGRTDLPARGFWKTVCTAPYVVPPYIAAIAWITLLNPTNGWINRGLLGVGLPALDVYSLGGMAWVMGLEATPFVMLATADSLARMDASLEEQARIAGASPWRTLRSVTLPLALPGVLTAASFVLASAAASFGVPYLLASGTATPDHVLTTRIYQALDLDPSTGRPVAVALSLVLLALGIGLPALLTGLRGRRRFTVVTGKATRVSPFALGAAKPLAVGFVALFAAVAVVLPLATITITSLLRTFGGGFDAENLTLANYAAVLGRKDAAGALLRSLWLAAAAATGAVALGTVLAWFKRRAPPVAAGFQPAAAVAWLARLPYAVPGTVLALGLLLAWSQEVRVIVLERVTLALALADTLWILGLAYVVKFLAFPVGQADSGLEAVDPSLEEAARMSGAGFATTLRTVTLPLLRPTLVAAWLLVFVPAFSEVTMSILLSGPDTRVVGTLLFDLQTYGDPPSAAVLAVVVTAIVLAGNAALRLAAREA